MAISGFFNIIFGIGAVLSQTWYVYTSNSAYLFDASGWGWAMIAAGILLCITASLLLSGNMFGRVLGSILVTASLLVNLALLPVAPIWSLIVIFVDVMVLYAIITHGGEMKRQLDE
jgi:hypothetical protein